jgi:hypothetical protein
LPDDTDVRLVRHTVLPEDITSVHDVPVVIGLLVTGAYAVAAAAVTGVLYAQGDPWVWHHWEGVGAVVSALSASTVVRVSPAIVALYPQAFTATEDDLARERVQARPLTARELGGVPWPSARQLTSDLRRARRWALRGVGAVVVPSVVALGLVAWAGSDVNVLPESDLGLWLALLAWTSVVSIAVRAAFRCDRNTLRALVPGRATATKVVEVRLARRRVTDGWGRRRRLVCDVRAVRPDGHLVEFTVREAGACPQPGVVVVLVGDVPRDADLRLAPRHQAGPGWSALAVVAGRPRATLHRVRHVATLAAAELSG